MTQNTNDSEGLKAQSGSASLQRTELSFDGKGINGPDEYRSRLATFTNQEAADRYGRLFAAAPDLLEAVCKLQMVAERHADTQINEQEWTIEIMKFAREAEAKAIG